MSGLEDLIAELCPDGIPFKKISDVASVERGKRVIRDQLPETGNYYVYQNSLIPLGHYNEYNYSENTTFIIGAGAAGEIGYSKEKFWAADDCYPIVCKNCLLDRYVYHFLLSKQSTIMSKVRRGSIPRLARQEIEKLVIPIPPVEIQCEIVSLLDKYEKYIDELIAKLTAELTARRNQYEYYRNVAFEFDDYESLQIAEIANTNIGLATSVTKHKRDKGIVLLHNSDIQQNRIVLKTVEFISEEFAAKNSSKLLQKDDIITVHTGDVGTSAVIDDQYAGSIGFTTITTRIKNTSKVLPHYLCHYLNTQKCKMDIASMTISDRSNLNQKNFEKLVVPVPSIQEQQRVTEILDRLSAAWNDMIARFPAEITARQKQYEHYRDKLLTFKERTA